MQVFLRFLGFRRYGAIVIEHVLLLCCVLSAFSIRFGVSPLELPGRERPLIKAFLVALVFQVFLHLRDVYDFALTFSFTYFFVRLGQALVFASSSLLILYFISPDLTLGRGVFFISLGLISIFLIFYHTLLRLYFGVRTPRSNILVIGTGRLARELVTEILRQPNLGIRVCGFLDGDPSLVGTSIVNPKVLGLFTDLPETVANHKVDRIVVELQDRRGQLPIQDLLKMKTRGIAIEDATSFYERIMGKIAIENLKPSWMIFNAGFEVSKWMLFQKRVLSLMMSTFLLILFSPIILLIICLIRLDSRGPIFYRQERVGRDGKVFTLFKFRSMCADAERETGPVWATEDDSRVTGLGRFLRRTRLDELPQLWNVLRGDMSLVGPRPERPVFVTELTNVIPFYHLRHSVKPGVTGWAQINYHYGNSVRDAVEKLQYDLFYIKHMSWLLDCLILLETIKTVLVRKGS